MIIAAYRDDGLLAQLSLACSLLLMRKRRESFPQRGCIGRVSTSFQATDLRGAKLKSIRLVRRPRLNTGDARLWRLTYELRIWPQAPRPSRSGLGSVGSGKAWGVGGAEISGQGSQVGRSPT